MSTPFEERCFFNHLTRCDWKGELDSIINHYQQEHNNFILNNDKIKINAIHYDGIHIVICNNNVFIFKFEITPTTRYLKCYLIGAHIKNVQIDYYIHIQLKSDKWFLNYNFLKIPFDNKPILDICINDTSGVRHLIKAKMRLSESLEELIRAEEPNQTCLRSIDVQIQINQQKDDGEIDDKRTETCVDDERIRDHCRFGCSFYGPIDDRYQNCEHRSFDCLLADDKECEWRGRRLDLVQHIIDNHQNRIKLENERILFTKNSSIFIKKANQLYYLQINHVKFHYYWLIEHLNQTSDVSRLKVVIDFFDIKPIINILELIKDKRSYYELKIHEDIFVDLMNFDNLSFAIKLDEA